VADGDRAGRSETDRKPARPVVAVVGVDNEELLCRLADPPLSTLAPNPGYEAAQLLDRLMSSSSTRPPGGFAHMEYLSYVFKRATGESLATTAARTARPRPAANKPARPTDATTVPGKRRRHRP
jgi:hypothetical protein